MTVETTDYTPGGEPLSECLNSELLITARNIECHGMLRMHAHDRLMNRIDQEIRSRGYGWYYYENNQTEWEKEVGVKWSIAKGGQQLKDEDHHECVACKDGDIFRVFDINGPLTSEWKQRISVEMTRLRLIEADKLAKWKEEQKKNPRKQTHMSTGAYLE